MMQGAFLNDNEAPHESVGKTCDLGCVEGRSFCGDDNVCHEKCFNTKTRCGDQIPRKDTYFCDYGEEERPYEDQHPCALDGDAPSAPSGSSLRTRFTACDNAAQLYCAGRPFDEDCACLISEPEPCESGDNLCRATREQPRQCWWDKCRRPTAALTYQLSDRSICPTEFNICVQGDVNITNECDNAGMSPDACSVVVNQEQNCNNREAVAAPEAAPSPALEHLITPGYYRIRTVKQVHQEPDWNLCVRPTLPEGVNPDTFPPSGRMNDAVAWVFASNDEQSEMRSQSHLSHPHHLARRTRRRMGTHGVQPRQRRP